MRIYSDEYTTIEHHIEQQYLKVFRDVPADIPQEEYKKSFIRWLNLIREYRPVFQLLNEAKNQFFITSELQEWINREILKPAFELGLRKMAIVVSRELLVSLSQEKVLEELEKEVGQNFKIEYFTSADMAEKWLLTEN